MLAYLAEFPPEEHMAQLTQAEFMYLLFKQKECPLFYDPDDDTWWVYNSLWRTSKGPMTRVRTLTLGSQHGEFGVYRDPSVCNSRI